MGPVGKHASEEPKSERAPRGSVPFAGFVRARAALSQTLGKKLAGIAIMGIVKFVIDRTAYAQGFDDAQEGNGKSSILMTNESYSKGYSDGMQERMTKGFEGSRGKTGKKKESGIIAGHNLALITCWACGETFQIALVNEEKITRYEEPSHGPGIFQMLFHGISNLIRRIMKSPRKTAWWEVDVPEDEEWLEGEHRCQEFPCKHCRSRTAVYFGK